MLSNDEFEEIQFLGKKCFTYKFKAKILPDRYLIKDMIEMEGKRWVEIHRVEYEQASQNCLEGLQD